MANKNVKLIISAKDQASPTIKGIERGFTSLKDSVFSMQGALSAIGITATLASATNAAKAAENANIGLAVSARYAGQSIDGTLAAAQALTQDGLLTMTEASLGLKNLLARGFSLDEATTLMNRFKDSAAFGRQASLGFGEAIVSATEGLKNENSILVDNAGVTKNVSVMWKEYAASIGTTADKLTQAQKREAEYQGVLIETEGQLGNAARSAQTMAGMQAQLAAETTKAQIALGNSLTPALLEIVPILTQLAGGVGSFIGGLQMMAAETAGFVDKINVLLHFDTVGAIFGDTTLEEQTAIVKARFAEINAIVEEQKQEIYDKATSVTAPDIGNDSGARRKDVVVPPPAGGAGKYDAAKVDQATEIDDINARVQAWVDGQNFLRDVQREESAAWREEYFSSLDIDKEMELDRINSAVDAWVAGEKMKQEASAAMRAGIGGILGDLSTLQNSHSRKAFEIGKASSIANAVVTTYEGATKAYSAMAGIPIVGPALGAAAAAAAIAAGMANVQAISSQKFGGGGGGRLTVGGAGGYAGVAASPIVTQPVATTRTEPSNTVNVTIVGNVVDHDKFAREVIPSIQKAFADGVA